MTLAQVVYHISTDRDFAAQWQLDPESALQQRGFKLSREELAFLAEGIRRREQDHISIISLSEIAPTHRWWGW